MALEAVQTLDGLAWPVQEQVSMVSKAGIPEDSEQGLQRATHAQLAGQARFCQQLPKQRFCMGARWMIETSATPVHPKNLQVGHGTQLVLQRALEHVIGS